MTDQDTPWKGLPPAPPGVPDQSPKPAGAPPQRPADDPWARPTGWRPPRPGRGSGGAPPAGSGSIARKVGAVLAVLVLFNVCARIGPDVTPERVRERAVPVDPVVEPFGSGDFRVGPAGPDPSLPQGWLRFEARGGWFRFIGPGRPTKEVTRRGGRYMFTGAPPLDRLTVEAQLLARGAASRIRPTLERETAILLDDLGAIARSRAWTGTGAREVLEVEAQRGDLRVRVRSFVAQRKLFRASVTWRGGPLDPDAAALVDRFVGGLAVGGAP